MPDTVTITIYPYPDLWASVKRTRRALAGIDAVGSYDSRMKAHRLAVDAYALSLIPFVAQRMPFVARADETDHPGRNR